MPHRQHLTAGLAAVLCMFSACASRTTTPEASPATSTKRPVPERRAAPVEGPVQAVVERDGEVTTELGIGSRAGLEVGTLLRIYGEVGGTRAFKGMLQVTELIGDDRALARAIGVTDRNAAVVVGDVVRPADLGAAYTDFKRELEAGRTATAAGTQAEEAAFAKLREHYQNELALSAGRFAQQREADLAQHQAELVELERAHAAAMERLRAELGAETLAIKAAMVVEAQSALTTDRAQVEERLKTLTEERMALAANAERLGQELVIARQAAVDQSRALESERQRHRAEVLAEVETRQILQNRLRELDGASTTLAPVLTLDPLRGETVLATLDRTSKNLAQASARVAVLEAELAEERERSAKHSESLTSAQRRIAELESAERQAGGATQRALELETQLKETKAALRTHELARLEAERQLFDLSAHLLAAEDAATISALQERLRIVIAGMASGGGP